MRLLSLLGATEDPDFLPSSEFEAGSELLDFLGFLVIMCGVWMFCLRLVAEEWEDVEAAATFALANGAQDLGLVGYSLGGGIVVSFLYNSVIADRVKGVILDAPALNLDEITDFRGSQERVFGVQLPSALTDQAKFLTTLRFGIVFDAMNHLKHAEELSASTPILLFHGSDDLSVPISLSEKFAKARPDVVEYHRFAGATHVGSWNFDTE